METINNAGLEIPKKKEDIIMLFSKDLTCPEVIRRDNCDYLNLYAGEPIANAQIVHKEVNRLVPFYKNITDAFYFELGRAVKDLKISERQLTKCVSRVIDKVRYHNITIADILSYITIFKLYRYQDKCDMITSRTHTEDDFILHKANGTNYFVLKRDLDAESQYL